MRNAWGLAGLVLALGIFAGEGVFAAQSAQPDPALAFQRYRLAAAQGDTAALDGLGSLFERGSSVPVDFAKAYALYHLAASRAGSDSGLVARATQHRDSLGARMSSVQLARVNELIALCNGSDVNHCGEIIIAAGGVAVASAAPQATSSGLRVSPEGKTIVPLEEFHGVYLVPAIVNGAASMRFAVDTGATDIAVPADVVEALVKAGFITQADFLGERIYRLADGSTIPSQTFVFRSVNVGNVVIENVRASVVPEKGLLLLGQSFLGRLKSWSMDNALHVLIIE